MVPGKASTSFAWLTVQVNVDCGLELHGNGETGPAIQAIELVKRVLFKDAFPKALSGSMNQRATLSRIARTGMERVGDSR